MSLLCLPALSTFPRATAVRIQEFWSHMLFPGGRSSLTRSHWFWPAFLVLFAVSWMVLIPNLSYALLEPDEGRYAEVAREMIRTREWVIPTLYFKPYCDKPPLFYWLIAGSFELFGVSAHSARLVPVSAALLTVASTFLFGTRAAGIRIGFVAGLILILSVGFANISRVLILDGVLTLTVSLSLFTAFEAIGGNTFRWGWWVGSAVASALGVLIKGPIAFILFAPPLVLHCWLTRAAIRPGFWCWLVYTSVLGAVSAPWFAAMMVRQPNYVSHFLWRHHLLRFFSPAFHPEPFWYYLPVICIAFLPWSLLFVPMIRYLFSSAPPIRTHRTQATGFFLLWASWCLLFFSVSRGKLPPYVMPAMPAIALLVAFHLDAILSSAQIREHFRRTVLHAPWMISGLLCVAVVAINPIMAISGSTAHPIGTVASIAWSVAGLALVLFGRYVNMRLAWVLCFLCAFLMNLQSVHRLVPAWANGHAPLAHARATKALLADDDMAVACYGREWGSIAFYTDRRRLLNFSLVPHSVLAEFFENQDRTLVFVKRTADLEWFRDAVPDGWEMRRIETIGAAKVALVKRTADSQGRIAAE
jgi:4-amino-4-deoxy-L-arabinose transferase-like glycosyltransferase